MKIMLDIPKFELKNAVSNDEKVDLKVKVLKKNKSGSDETRTRDPLLVREVSYH